MVRIISGRWRGRRIEVPSTGTRPTSDRAREAVFSSLAMSGGEKVLDLFAGSGAYGFEALSRGAESAVFVDSGRDATAVLAANIDALEAADETEVIGRGWESACESLAGRRFDLVFVDPPWQECAPIGKDLARLISPLLEPDATVVCESPAADPMEVDLPLLRERRYGATLIRFHGLS